MKFHQSNLLKQFSNLASLFTTKESGNLAFHVGDAKENVVKNHKLLANELAYSYGSLTHMQQIHSNKVHKLTAEDNFFHPPSCDALITNEKNRPLMVMVADCSPLLFYDAAQEVIAVAHAGRAGAFSNIVQNVIDMFVQEYHSHKKDIYVSVGTSIQKCCYEVGYEIYEEAKTLSLEYAIEKRDEKYYLDIQKILHKQLGDAGIRAKNCEFSTACTACSTQKYYSYRAEQKTGRFAGVIFLKD